MNDIRRLAEEKLSKARSIARLLTQDMYKDVYTLLDPVDQKIVRDLVHEINPLKLESFNYQKAIMLRMYKYWTAKDLRREAFRQKVPDWDVQTKEFLIGRLYSASNITHDGPVN